MPAELGTKFRVRIAAAEARLRAVSDNDAEQEFRPGGWLRKEVLGHLIDSALNNHQRFVRGSIHGSYEGPGYAQEEWVDAHGYRDFPWTTLLMHWRMQNHLLANVVDRIPESRLAAECKVAGDEPVSLGFLIEDYLGHLEHHVGQIVR
jgi:hypothetical protein